jgi:ATP-binding cassette subfamily B protein
MFKRFIHYYKPHKVIFILDMIAAFLVAAIGMGYPILTRYILNDVVPSTEMLLDDKWVAITVAGVSLLAIYLLRMFLRHFIQYYGHVMGVRMQAQMRTDMFTKLQKLPFSYYDSNETGRIMSRMTSDLFEVSELAHHGPENILIAGFTLIGSLTYLFIINVWLALICVVMIPVLFSVSLIFRRKMKDAFTESRKAIAGINAKLESSITGIRITKAYTNSEKELEKFEESNREFMAARRKAYSAMAKFFASSSFVTDVFNVVILVAGGVFVLLGQIDYADYATFIISVNLFIQPINQLIQFMEQYQNGTTGFKRFLEIMDEKEESDEGKLELTNVEGNITFENVNFDYATANDILKDVSFDIKPGKTIALVGPTGGGKSTICHLIPRFYNIKEGDIKIDGTSIYDLTLDSLRKNIGIVQQDVFLFNGTIKSNILYGNLNATDEEVIDACKKANLYDYIQTLENGLDSEIGERGVRLSGGQKQRISIARAFLKNPKILILDEATSALDNTTEMLIQNALNKLCEGRTTIVVAHRLTTIKNADEILVISGGKIIEQGSHDELLNKEEGAYKVLYDNQFKDINFERTKEIESSLLIN